MATRIRRHTRPHLYLEEWISYRGLNPASLAGRMDMDRSTVWRWVKEQHRLNPEKMAHLADALDVEVRELFSPPPDHPSRASLDSMLRDQPDDVHDMAHDIVSRLIKRAS